jgi:hypothetical protein
MYLKENTTHEDGAICVQYRRDPDPWSMCAMLTILRYLLLIVTAMLDHFCSEFCLPHSDRAAQGTDMAAVSIHRPLDERQRERIARVSKAPLASVLHTHWDVGKPTGDEASRAEAEHSATFKLTRVAGG